MDKEKVEKAEKDWDGWVYVPKHVRVYAEIIRTLCAMLAVTLNGVVLYIVLTK